MDRKDYQREYYLVHRKLKSEKMTNQINRPKKYQKQEEIKIAFDKSEQNFVPFSQKGEEPIIVIKKPKKLNQSFII